MRILLVTPLYPPDIAEPAPYVKELAVRLCDTHEITILAYNHIPEKINGVRIISIEKYMPLLARLITFMRILYSEAKRADIVYVQNGPSTELPLVFVSLLVRTPCILRLGDETALKHGATTRAYRALLLLAVRYARVVVTHRRTSEYTHHIIPLHDKKSSELSRPLPRPEILPFAPFPHDSISAYKSSWDQHLTELESLYKVCKNT